MTVDEYINNVTFKIKNKVTRKNVEKELQDYIDDRKDSYISMGYDEDAATQKALERMGSGEIVGEQFNQLYNKKIIDCLHFYVIFSDIIIFLFFLMGKLFFLNTLFQCQQDFNFIVFTTESLLICIFLSSFVISIVTKRKSVLYVPFISMFLFTLYYIISKASPLLIYIYFLLCKKAENLELLTRTLYNGNIVKFSFLTIISFIFYSVLFALFIICLKLVNDFIKCRFSKKDIIIKKQ